MKNSRLVYSTETGRVCPKCSQPGPKCICKRKKTVTSEGQKKDGIIRIQREKKGRKGKTVTTVIGVMESESGLKRLASELKNSCGTGGAVKDGIIIIQGDHRDRLVSELKKRGLKVKLAGG